MSEFKTFKNLIFLVGGRLEYALGSPFQILTLGSFAAFWPARMQSISFKRSIFFLKDTFLKKCVAALLR